METHMTLLLAVLALVALYLLQAEWYTPHPAHENPFKSRPMPLDQITTYDAEAATLRQKENDMLTFTPQPGTLFPNLPTW